MLSKLLKYDLKWCFKPLAVFYLLSLFFAVVVRILESMEKSLIIVILDKICVGALISMIISILINCFMRNWARFVENIYKDESYLTHTLPVSKNKIYLSKVLTAAITLLVSFIVITLCLAIAVLTKDSWIFIKTTLEQSAIYFDSSVFSLVFIMLITVFFEVLFMIMSGILGIVIGHKSNNLKIIKSIVYGFIIYMLFSAFSVSVLYIFGLLNPEIMTLFTSMTVSSNTLKGMMLIAILIYGIYILITYFIGNKLFNKGVNVD